MSPPSDRPSTTGEPVARARLSTRRRFLLTCGAGAVALGLSGLKSRAGNTANPSQLPDGPLAGLKFARRTLRALGSEMSILVLHEDRAVGESALDRAFAEIARVEQVMSIYLPESQVSRLNAAGVLKQPDPYLVRILNESCAMSGRSAGAFDITVQPLWATYETARQEGRLPAPEAVAEARQHIDWRGVSVSEHEVSLRTNRMAVTLNGIAQGFAADRAMEALKRHGIEHALVNAGEISSLGKKATGDPWVTGIQHPRQKDAYLGLAELDGRCMSTSGDYETAFTPDFKFNHIFDPSTGRSPEEFSSVTVVAPDATTADALSTAIFVLGADRGQALAAEIPGTDVLLVMKDQRTLATRAFPWCRESRTNPDSAPA